MSSARLSKGQSARQMESLPLKLVGALHLATSSCHPQVLLLAQCLVSSLRLANFRHTALAILPHMPLRGSSRQRIGKANSSFESL